MRTRRTVQSLLFLLFLFLLFHAAYHEKWEWLIPFLPPDLFLKLDPLTALSVSLSERAWVKGAFMIVPLLIATIFLGRAFCGWICPLGTTLDLFETVARSPQPKQRQKDRSIASRGNGFLSRFTLRSKYYLLLALAAAALLGAQTAWVLDPIPIVTRSFALAVFPAAEWLARLVGDKTHGWNVAADAYSWLQDHVLSYQQPRFAHSWPALAVFAVIVLLSLDARRWWCRKLCPLGAMLGLLSWKKPLRIRTGTPCSGCGECSIHCKMEAIEIERKESGATIRVDNRECILCSDCIDRCPKQVLGYAWGGPKEQAAPTVDLPRRRVAAALLVGAAVAPAIQLDTARSDKNRAVLRPPNSLPEEEFLNRCIRCGACIKVCPTVALHPALFEAGPGGMFSPLLIPRIGYCSYECALCGQVCPTGAIPFFTPEHKHARSIGYAMFDKNRCIPYREYKDCLVCEEHCPVSPKAIVFVQKEALLEDGSVRSLKFPDVKPERCVGCGVCENVCPLDGASAIQVQPYRPQKTLEEIARTRGGASATTDGTASSADDPYGGQ